MKTLTVSDLVPVTVLYNIAKRVRAEAAKIANSKNVPIKSANEIGITAAKITQSQTQINLTIPQKLAAYEWGSGIHGKKHAKYPITAKNTSTLVFMGTNAWAGVLIWWRKTIQHPGVAARPFLEPAKRATRQRNLEDIRKTNLANTKLIIRGMSRKV